MSSQNLTGRSKVKGAVAVGGAVAATLLMTGCSENVKNGFLPTKRGTTDNVDVIMDLWVGSWVAALAVGLVTWGLMLWCIVAYRRRKADRGFPRQVSYHAPLEVFYTLVPIIMILSLFTFSDHAERDINRPWSSPDVKVEVYGKQWSWDFNYLDENVYSQGTQARLDGKSGQQAKLPTLYLPADSEVTLVLKSRDVIHSFWVPAYLQKVDTIPGQTNHMYFKTGKQTGEYQGKCAELCGEYHSEMLFNVKVVSKEDYQKQMQKLKDAHQTGRLGDEYNRNPNQNETK